VSVGGDAQDDGLARRLNRADTASVETVFVNVLTHFFTGWALAQATTTGPRDRALVTWASVLPDLDGLSILPDLANRALGRPETDFYLRYHHAWTHGLPAAILTAIAASLLARKKIGTSLLVFLAFHVHLLCDLAGSRGPTPADIWPIGYLEPFSQRWTVSWQGQWALNDWRNILFTALLLALTGAFAVSRGHSPVSLFSVRADAAVVAALRGRFVRGR
jgi:inner membrane protein